MPDQSRIFSINTMLHIKSVKYLSGFRLWVAFDDGTEGQVDLQEHLRGPIFEPLQDERYFARVSIDPELETIVWPNGADFAPEFVKQVSTEQS